MLVGEEEESTALLQRPFEDFAGVGGGTAGAAVKTDKGFEVGGGVDVGDGNERLFIYDARNVAPGVLHRRVFAPDARRGLFRGEAGVPQRERLLKHLESASFCGQASELKG